MCNRDNRVVLEVGTNDVLNNLVRLRIDTAISQYASAT